MNVWGKVGGKPAKSFWVTHPDHIVLLLKGAGAQRRAHPCPAATVLLPERHRHPACTTSQRAPPGPSAVSMATLAFNAPGKVVFSGVPGIPAGELLPAEPSPMGSVYLLDAIVSSCSLPGSQAMGASASCCDLGVGTEALSPTRPHAIPALQSPLSLDPTSAGVLGAATPFYRWGNRLGVRSGSPPLGGVGLRLKPRVSGSCLFCLLIDIHSDHSSHTGQLYEIVYSRYTALLFKL